MHTQDIVDKSITFVRQKRVYLDHCSQAWQDVANLKTTKAV